MYTRAQLDEAFESAKVHHNETFKASFDGMLQDAINTYKRHPISLVVYAMFHEEYDTGYSDVQIVALAEKIGINVANYVEH